MAPPKELVAELKTVFPEKVVDDDSVQGFLDAYNFTPDLNFAALCANMTFREKVIDVYDSRPKPLFRPFGPTRPVSNQCECFGAKCFKFPCMCGAKPPSGTEHVARQNLSLGGPPSMVGIFGVPPSGFGGF
jgi:hypothetical protein